MRKLDTWGGAGSLVAAATFVVGLVMFATVLTDYTSATQPADAVAFMVDNQGIVAIRNLVITIVFGIAIVPLVLALRDRLADGTDVLARVSAVFGLIWSGLIIATGMIVNVGNAAVAGLHDTDPGMAANLWTAVDTVANGLGGGNEIVGGIWVLLASLAALRTGQFGKVIGYLGLTSGVAGLVTAIPALEPVGAVFGLGLIVWFIAVGLTLLRDRAETEHGVLATPALDRA